MKDDRRRAQLRRQMKALCAELGPEDGQDPYLYHQHRVEPGRGRRRKERQLCGQVARALELALGAAGHPALNATTVESVHPAGTTARLDVVLIGPAGLGAALEAAAGWLRDEVARSVHRRRVPFLAFHAKEVSDG